MAQSGEREAIVINYSARAPERPRYFANDHSRDTVIVEQHDMRAYDGRATPTSLDDAGFMLVDHKSALSDFSDRETAARVHCPEIAELVQRVTGADFVQCKSPPLARFSERSGKAGSRDNSYPARFCHVDVSDATGSEFALRSAEGRPFRRAAHYNVWRALSPAPQDVPLAMLDARSVSDKDLILADAIFDSPGGDWQFESYVVAHNPAHRWFWYPDLTAGEAIIFKTHDSLKDVATCVPHVAFDDPRTPQDAPPRVSIEMRAIAYWWD
ncbi:MAG: hypothetical protein J7494_04815 [Sphingobium sp.]|nr:hypothetical protein [Sphingobium sp.]